MSSPGDRPAPADLSLPLLLGLVALVLFLAFQTYALLQQRAALQAAFEGQVQPTADASKLRQQLDTLAGGTAELARKGNERAQQIVSDLAKQGVAITPPK